MLFRTLCKSKDKQQRRVLSVQCRPFAERGDKQDALKIFHHQLDCCCMLHMEFSGPLRITLLHQLTEVQQVCTRPTALSRRTQTAPPRARTVCRVQKAEPPCAHRAHYIVWSTMKRHGRSPRPQISCPRTHRHLHAICMVYCVVVFCPCLAVFCCKKNFRSTYLYCVHCKHIYCIR